MNAAVDSVLQISQAELIRLAAADDVFYCRTFFPKTFRQKSPAWHRQYWEGFNDPNFDFFGAEIFRGGAKTTLTRAGISKRIAYAISRNVLSVAISETMATHTLRWLKKQIEQNHFWTDTFQLRKGSKWTDDWIEIINVSQDCSINVIAKGMTSGLRGLNPDDWRPDFIQCDDISNEETVGTDDQLKKQEDLFFGAIVGCLAPKSEAPLRKLVLNQTGLASRDLINQAHTDPRFKTMKFPKLVEQPDGSFESAWPERFPLAEVLKEKDDYTAKGQLHIWLREYGCKIISRETAPLDPTHLRKWTSLPTDLDFYIGLDPAISKAKTAHRTAGFVLGVSRSTADVFVIAYKAQQGQNPDQMWIWLLAHYRQYRPRKTGVETVAFQKFLKWYFEKKMLEDKTFFAITEVDDRRSKPDRIMQAFPGLAAQGRLWVHENQTEFIEMYTTWNESLDYDLLDAGAQAITLANPWLALPSNPNNEGEPDYADEEKDIPELVFEGGCP